MGQCCWIIWIAGHCTCALCTLTWITTMQWWCPGGHAAKHERQWARTLLWHIAIHYLDRRPQLTSLAEVTVTTAQVWQDVFPCHVLLQDVAGCRQCLRWVSRMCRLLPTFLAGNVFSKQNDVVLWTSRGNWGVGFCACLGMSWMSITQWQSVNFTSCSALIRNKNRKIR